MQYAAQIHTFGASANTSVFAANEVAQVVVPNDGDDSNDCESKTATENAQEEL